MCSGESEEIEALFMASEKEVCYYYIFVDINPKIPKKL
jgi:hypothetical protein